MSEYTGLRYEVPKHAGAESHEAAIASETRRDPALAMRESHHVGVQAYALRLSGIGFDRPTAQKQRSEKYR